jgi:hypothetical protein
MPMIPAPPNVREAQRALMWLRQARDALTSIGAVKAADRVRAAIRSAEGARRHAIRMSTEPHAGGQPAPLSEKER